MLKTSQKVSKIVKKLKSFQHNKKCQTVSKSFSQHMVRLTLAAWKLRSTRFHSLHCDWGLNQYWLCDVDALVGVFGVAFLCAASVLVFGIQICHVRQFVSSSGFSFLVTASLAALLDGRRH